MASNDFYGFPETRPGPASGVRRPFDAPTSGDVGGRPSGPGSVGMISNAPMMSLGSDAALGPGVPSAPAPAPTSPAGPQVAGPPPVQPAGVTINIGGGQGVGGRGERPGPRAPNAPRGDFGDVEGGSSSTASGVPTGDGQGQSGTDRTGGGGGGPYDSQGGVRGTEPGSLWPDVAGPGSLWPDVGAPGSLWPDASQPMELAQSPDEATAARVLEGQQVITPLGSSTRHLGQMGDWSLTPEGQESYRRATLAARERYGTTLFQERPDAPQPEIIPGRMEFNPMAAEGHGWLLPE